MRECTVCAETDFEEHDGHFFCSTCNTQSQDVRVTVADTDNFDNFRRGLIRETGTTRESRRKISDHGRPWSVYEAYQIIIQHQVDALIELGAKESLRDVVFQIWVNYLSALGVAFSNATVPKVKYERQRDLFPSTTDHPKIKNVFSHRSRRKTQGPTAKKAQKQLERDKTIEALRGEEFYDEDNPLNDSVETEHGSQTAGWSSGEEDDGEQKWGRYRKSLRFDAVEKVRMASTVAVCYLGLMHTNPITTATDLIRWIQNKKIPYLNVRPILPADMKFCLNDWKLFGMGTPPTLEQLRRTAGTIAYYIGLKNFPEFPLDDLINKYIIQLDLPAEFQGYAMNTFKAMQIHLQFIPSERQKLTIYWEAIATAYIVIVLKLFFGFNDSTEILMSEYSKELSEISECAKPLFVWTDWVQHMKNRMQIEDQKKSITADRKLAYSHVCQRIDMSKYNGRLRLYQQSFRDSLASPFHELSKRVKAADRDRTPFNLYRGNTDQAAEIDFDISTLEEVNDPLEILELENSRGNDWNDELIPEPEDREVDKEIRRKSDSFRKSTVQHLLRPDSYLAETNSQQEGKTESLDFSLSEVIKDEFRNGSNSPRKRRRTEKSGRRLSQSNVDMLEEEEAGTQHNMEKYQAVIEKLKDLRENAEASLDFESKGMCLSYDWLIKICCHTIPCEADQLRNMILKLELMFFSDPDDDCMNKTSRLHRKRLRNDPQYFANTILMM